MLEIGVPLATNLIEKEENVPQFKKKTDLGKYISYSTSFTLILIESNIYKQLQNQLVHDVTVYVKYSI
jgi:hypothetical protein